MKILEQLKVFFWPLLVIFGAIYGKYQGRKSEKSKADAMLLDDFLTSKKSDNAIDSLGDNERSKRVRFFTREAREERRKK